MTREEKQKTINALKISAPIMAMTQEEFNDYIQTLNKIMDWLEQEPCEDAISRTELLARIDEERKYLHDLKMDGAEHIVVHHARRIIEDMPPVTPQEPFMNKPCVSNQVCHEDKVKVLEKIRAEIDEARFIDKDTKLCKNANASGLEMALEIIDKYNAESEDKE